MRVFIGQRQSNELFGVSTNCYSLIRRKEISRQEKLIKDCQEHSSISTFFAKVIDWLTERMDVDLTDRIGTPLGPFCFRTSLCLQYFDSKLFFSNK